MFAAERAPRHRWLELAEVERIRDQANRAGVDAEAFQLLPLKRRDRQHAGRALDDATAVERVEAALENQPAFDARRRPVGRQHIRHPPLAQVAGGNRAGKVTAGMQVRDVEVCRVIAHVLRKPHRRKGLVAIRQPVGDVGEDSQRDARLGRTGWPRTVARRLAAGQP